MNKLRTKAEKLRGQGYSYRMIQMALGVSPSTMSYWFKDKPFTPNQEMLNRIKYGPMVSGARSHNRRVQEIRELKELGKKELGKLSKRDLWMFGLGIYLGEGSKTTEGIRISNSDPALIAVAVRWFKEICGLSVDNIVIRIHIYPDTDVRAAVKFWQGATGLPLANFRKPIIDQRTDKKVYKRGKLPHGTAHISVIAKGDPSKGVKLYRRIDGWISGALNQV